MVARGAKLVLLPIDVRPTDLEALEDLEGHRTDDGRAYASIGGMAQRSEHGSLAFARIEVLLAPAADRTFAHEFAHLAFWHLSAEEQAYFVTALNGAYGGKVIPVPGGILIRDKQGRPIGAVGVTGDTSDNDAAAGLAGVEAAGLTGEA